MRYVAKYRVSARRVLIVLALCVSAFIAGTQPAHAFSLNLDSIAAMGKFPKFCIDTYRWGDKFFNGYDTTYVAPTGYRFNVKLRTDSWLDYNTFRLDNNHYEMDMHSYPSTSAGLWLTYMAVSVGYDINVSQLLNITHSSRKRFNFQFNCMLFSADLYLTKSDAKMKISRFGPADHTHEVDIPYNGMRTSEWGLETYYFFNHKHYSQAAAFNYGRIQRRSSGSLFAGLSLSGNDTRFDFSMLPAEMLERIPASWPHYVYKAHMHNYAFKLGYAYNWMLSRRCMIGLSDAPSVGIRYGYVSSEGEGSKNAAYLFNRFKVSFVFNRNHWFAGIVGVAATNLVGGKDHMLITNNLSAEVSVGYRFNLW